MLKNSILYTSALTLASGLLASCATEPSIAQGNTPDAPRVELSSDALACAALGKKNFETGADRPFVIQSTSYKEAAPVPEKAQMQLHKRSMSLGIHARYETLPNHCEVKGYIAPAIHFIALLPDQQDWKDRTLYGACDALCGEAQPDMPIPGMVQGFAAIATDGGHVNKRPFDGVWGYMNDQGQKDFGYEASHLAAQSIKAMATEFYKDAPDYSYIAGFSKGGAAGVKAALTYPNDFDGVLSRAPTVNYQAINSIRMPWIYNAVHRADGSAILTADLVPLIHGSVLDACDANDGLTDRMIEDPRSCSYDPAVLECAPEESEACLTTEQVTALRKMYTPPKGSDGSETYPYAQEYGSETDWPMFILPLRQGVETFSQSISRTYIRYLAFPEDPGPEYDWKSFDAATEGGKLDALSYIYDANEPNLSEFKDAGGKMIVLHGWSDGAISARSTIDWYANVQAEMGDVDNFLKFFLIPGSEHGHGGDGPNLQNSLATLVDWVENGTVPTTLLLTSESDEGDVLRTRPAYPYPLKATYSGKGDIDEASSFGPGK